MILHNFIHILCLHIYSLSERGIEAGIFISWLLEDCRLSYPVSLCHVVTVTGYYEEYFNMGESACMFDLHKLKPANLFTSDFAL